jgi:molecular chaperone DnaK
MRIGIDLGTTFCCVAALDTRGWPVLVPNECDEVTTPSVFWFDGHEAWIGHCAYVREAERPGFLVDYVKRDMGRPAEIPAHLYDHADAPATAPYAYGGFAFGVVGMQALLLRKLKRDALRYFQREGMLPADLDEPQVRLDAVITVPAYFKDVEREQTRQAGECAGLRVIGIINEPTAAALAYRLVRSGTRRIVVFDLGGGTFDVTVLELRADGASHVLASDGNPQLGGKDWDDLIVRHLRDVFFERAGKETPREKLVELYQKTVEGKKGLSVQEAVQVEMVAHDGTPLSTELFRRLPEGVHPYEAGDGFYFERRAMNLLSLITAICERTRKSVRIKRPDGSEREMEWDDVDDVVMVGGSCRMPMIPKLLETLTGKEIRRHPEGFDFDTAVAIGAASYAQRRDLVHDVASGSFGLKLRRREDGVTYDFVQHLVRKNTPLPVGIEREYRAGANAVLQLYQGESENPEECVLRGRLELNNPEGLATVALNMDRDGRLTAAVSLPGTPGEAPVQRTIEIKNELYDAQQAALCERVQAVTIHPCCPPADG